MRWPNAVKPLGVAVTGLPILCPPISFDAMDPSAPTVPSDVAGHRGRAVRAARASGESSPGRGLALAAGLRLWRLDQNGFDNEYYAAAVRSMMASWHAFLLQLLRPGRLRLGR